MRLPRNRGFSLIELLVVTSVLAILLGISLPAIQMARGAAQRAKCLANLKQMAAAVHLYHDVHHMVPSYYHGSGAVKTGGEASYFSIHCMLLPYLEENATYDGLNFVRSLPQVYSAPRDAWEVHHTISRKRVAVFLCPADGRTSQWSGANSYRGNWGTGPYWLKTAEYPDSANGIFCAPSFGNQYPVPFSAIIDGTSKTALWTERLVGTDGAFDPQRDIYQQIEISRTAEQQRANCFATSQANAPIYYYSGRYWLFTGINQTLYTHILPPNSQIPDCQSFVAVPPWGAGTARSRHPGGVNVAMVDGSVRFISDAIGNKVWAALGSRDGGEVILESSY